MQISNAHPSTNTNQSNSKAFGNIQLADNSSSQSIRDRYTHLKSQTDTKPVASNISSEIFQIANQEIIDPASLIKAAMKIPELEFLFKQDARVLEGYSIEQHTGMVLLRIEKFCRTAQCKIPLTLGEFRLAALLHDCGKPLPDDKSDQHLFTLNVIEDLRDYIKVNDGAYKIICSLIDNDPFGHFITRSGLRLSSPTKEQRLALASISSQRSLTIEELKEFIELVQLKDLRTDPEFKNMANEIALTFKKRAEELGVLPEELFNLHVMFFQIDTSAYSYDAKDTNGVRAFASLDYLYQVRDDFIADVNEPLFEYQKDSGLLKFSPGISYFIEEVRNVLLSL